MEIIRYKAIGVAGYKETVKYFVNWSGFVSITNFLEGLNSLS